MHGAECQAKHVGYQSIDKEQPLLKGPENGTYVSHMGASYTSNNIVPLLNCPVHQSNVCKIPNLIYVQTHRKQKGPISVINN
jgi:hypothetical protein